MNYKVKGALKKNKKYFVITIILWLFIAIVFVSPLAYSMHQAKLMNDNIIDAFFNQFATNVISPFSTLGKIFADGVSHEYFSLLFWVSLLYLIFVFIGISKSKPKSEFEDIEHGSSDWSQNGEQYRVLNRNKGILLAENNYLPVDKRGNTNVLVVGRFRFW